MRKLLSVPLLGMSVLCSLLTGCDSNSSQQFATKQDSLLFAKSVLQKYPGEEMGATLQQDTTGPARGRSFRQGGPGEGVQPISWETVLLYQSNYDKDPQIKAPAGYFYQGFTVDSAAYQRIIKTSSIKGLYLRLGKKEDNSYTIMILGLDANGNVMNGKEANRKPGDSTNYDHTDPCPENCPVEPEN